MFLSFSLSVVEALWKGLRRENRQSRAAGNRARGIRDGRIKDGRIRARETGLWNKEQRTANEEIVENGR